MCRAASVRGRLWISGASPPGRRFDPALTHGTTVSSYPSDPVIAAKARELRQTIAELLADGAKRGWSKVRKRDA
jgi:hypothetical protein